MYKGWKRTLYLVWFVQIFSLMSFSLGLPFLPYYIQELGVVDPDRISLFTGILSAAPAIGMGIMAPIWGVIADRKGKKPMLLRALLSASVILTGLGLVKSVWGVLIFRGMQGFLTGTTTAASALIAAKTPGENMSYALGIMASSTFIGRSIGPAAGGFLADSLGYRPSFFLGGALMLLCFLAILFFVKEDKIAHSDKGDGNKGGFFGIITFPVAITLGLIFFLRMSRSVAAPYIPLYVQQIRGTVEGSSLITGLISAGASVTTALSAMILTRLGDKRDKKKLITIYVALGLVVSIPLLLVESLAGFAVTYALLFFAMGGIDPLVMSYSVELVPENKRGLLFGIRGTVGSLAWAISPMAGSYFSINYSVETVFVLIPVFLVFTLAVALFLKGRTKAAS